MADDTDGVDKAKPKSRTKLIIVAAAAAALLLGGGGGAYVMLSGGGDHGASGDHAAAESDGHGAETTAEAGPAAFFVDLPEMLVNLATIDREKQRYLRLAVALEVGKPEMAEAIKPMMPRVLDSFQTHLRELRPDDIRGSSGAYRLKEELLRRVNTAIAPAKVDAVLFKDIVVQ
ncbi:flagellar basal body-associated FliL family protein [Hansschlegelia sp. KR7-227]|uniref:flagellar basal body-associated FliL family protein n=1 Tax=Hansschlegelia sp. KR7-227 TaxID=3400914 RepID=UPI003C0D4179